MTVADEIAKLSELKKSGSITEEEFEAQKKSLLGSAPASNAGNASAPQPAVEPAKTSVLAILAFVFSFIIGPLGFLLAIIAIIVIAASKKRLRGIGFAIGAICVSLFLWGILAATAVPAFINYMRRAKTSEATLNVDRIFEEVVTYYEAEHIGGPAGSVITHQLPQSTGWTPAVPCCEQTGEKCVAADNIDAWNTPAWKSLDFGMGDNFYYQYRFIVEGDEFFCQARGDLDCDGNFSLFERAGIITDDGFIQGSSGIYKKDPLE